MSLKTILLKRQSHLKREVRSYCIDVPEQEFETKTKRITKNENEYCQNSTRLSRFLGTKILFNKIEKQTITQKTINFLKIYYCQKMSIFSLSQSIMKTTQISKQC